MVVADLGSRNGSLSNRGHVERLPAFLSVTAETGRRLVVQPQDIYLLRCISQADSQTIALRALDALAVYADLETTPRR